ncbi:MAG: hypothetical protein COT74_04060 [Bdellovibrionales bacterium CG10_big_fil_rev_8_21_14_0_10_45_34]|nr:MAG: hypothetical protein COT74_04060 [Bdellovibrionales bacterium CG10_big_fil_rev_8_21_14_0_10_45_34]
MQFYFLPGLFFSKGLKANPQKLVFLFKETIWSLLQLCLSYSANPFRILTTGLLLSSVAVFAVFPVNIDEMYWRYLIIICLGLHGLVDWVDSLRRGDGQFREIKLQLLLLLSLSVFTVICFKQLAFLEGASANQLSIVVSYFLIAPLLTGLGVASSLVYLNGLYYIDGPLENSIENFEKELIILIVLLTVTMALFPTSIMGEGLMSWALPLLATAFVRSIISLLEKYSHSKSLDSTLRSFLRLLNPTLILLFCALSIVRSAM